MSFLTPPEVIGTVPLEMFSELDDVLKQHEIDMKYRLGLDIANLNYGFGVGDQSTYSETDKKIEGILSPLVVIINDFESQTPDSLFFDITSGIVPPKHFQRGDGRWHRDHVESRSDHFVTASALPTDFKYHRPLNPGDVVHFRRHPHRSPKNKTKHDIYRTWIRATTNDRY